MQNSISISEMSLALVKIFKEVARNINSTVQLKDELELIKNFITIQQYRYEDSFKYEIHLEDPSLLDLYILKFSLQPLVENSIFHGFVSGNKEYKLQLIIKSVENDLLIHIFDNGEGMSPEQIYSSLNTCYDKNHRILKGIGMYNINKRIKIEYGEQYGLSIESEVGRYTDITVRYPIQRKPESE